MSTSVSSEPYYDFTTFSTDLISNEPSTNAEEVLPSKASLGAVDIVVIICYIVATFCVGIWASRSGNRNSIKGYFLAGQNMFWVPVGASAFASNIGTGHFIGLAGTGAASGIAVGSFEWIAAYNLLQLGWVFLPIYFASKVYTMPEYLSKRFGGVRLRITLSVISLALYVLTKIAVDLYAGALFIQQAFKINLYVAIVSLLVITAIYTVLGGLKAVIYTDTIQTVVMLIGGILLMILGFIKIGGYDNLTIQYMGAIPQTTIDILASGNRTTCGIPREDAFHLFRDPISSDIPWPGMLLGIYFLGSWYWCTDQVIVQRTLAAKNLAHAKAGCVMAGFLKVLPMYMIVMTGMISRVLFPNEVACAEETECKNICGNPQGCSNIAYPKLVLKLLPTGLRGVMVAAILSALMSSLTSIFNSSSTIFTLDIWKRIRKSASEREMLVVGKITVCILVVISILWIPVILSSAGGQLYVYLQSIQSALGPPIFVLYLFAVLWPRTNEQIRRFAMIISGWWVRTSSKFNGQESKEILRSIGSLSRFGFSSKQEGAFWGLVSGFTVGVVRLILDFTFSAPGCDEEETRPWILHRVNFLYVAPIVFVISSVTTTIISLCTKPLPEEKSLSTTWFSPSGRKSLKSDPQLRLQVCEEEINEETQDVGTENRIEAGLPLKTISEENSTYLSKTEIESADSVFFQSNNDENLKPTKWDKVIDISGIFLAVATAFLMGYYA